MAKRKLSLSRKEQEDEENNSSITELSSIASDNLTTSPPRDRKGNKSLKRLGSVSKLVRKSFRKKKKKNNNENREIFGDNTDDTHVKEVEKEFASIVDKDLNEDNSDVNCEARIYDNDKDDEKNDNVSKDDSRSLHDRQNESPPALVEDSVPPSVKIIFKDIGVLDGKNTHVTLDDCDFPENMVGSEALTINENDVEDCKYNKSISRSDANYDVILSSELAIVAEQKNDDKVEEDKTSTGRSGEREENNECANFIVGKTKEDKRPRMLEEQGQHSFDTGYPDEKQRLQEQEDTTTAAKSSVISPSEYDSLARISVRNDCIAFGNGGKSVRSYIIVVLLLITTLALLYVSYTTLPQRVQYSSHADSKVIRNIVTSRKMRASLKSKARVSVRDGTDKVNMSNIPSANEADVFAAITKNSIMIEHEECIVTTDGRSASNENAGNNSQRSAQDSTILPHINVAAKSQISKCDISQESDGAGAAVGKKNMTRPFKSRVQMAFARMNSTQPQMLMMLATL